MQHLEREVRILEVNSSADTSISAERGTGGAPGTGAEIALQPVVKPLAKQLCPSSPWSFISEQTCTWTPHWTMWKLPAGSWSLWRAHTEQSLLQDWTQWPEPTLEQIPEALQLQRRSQGREFCEGLYPWGGTPCWRKGKTWGERSSRDEALWTDHDPIPHSLYHSGLGSGGKQEEMRGLWACEEGKGRGKVFFAFQWFSLFYSVTINWQWNKRNLNNFLKSSLFSLLQ